MELRLQIIDFRGIRLPELHIIFRFAEVDPCCDVTLVTHMLSQRVEPIEQRAVPLPVWNVRESGRVSDLIEGFSFHLKIGARIDLRRCHAFMANRKPGAGYLKPLHVV